MERFSLNVQQRQGVGKGVARSLRRNGVIPAILYKKGSSLPIQIFGKELLQLATQSAGEQILINLQFPNEVKQAILKEYQKEPTTGKLIHVDFQEILATEEIEITVKIVTNGEAIGVKRDGGILQYGLREIEVKCLPDKIPGHIVVDISNLSLGQSIHVRDLQLDKDIKILTEPQELIITITTIKEEAPPVEVVPIETTEPEVIKKGKKVEEEKSE